MSEARSQEDGLFGEDRLIGLLRDCATRDAAFIADEIEQRVRGFRDRVNTDDLAVLASGFAVNAMCPAPEAP